MSLRKNDIFMIFIAFVLGFITQMLIKTICGDVVEGVGDGGVEDGGVEDGGVEDGPGCSAGGLCPDLTPCPLSGKCPPMCAGNPEGTDDVDCTGAGKHLRVDADSTQRGPHDDTDAHIANCCQDTDPADDRRWKPDNNYNECNPPFAPVPGGWHGCQAACTNVSTTGCRQRDLRQPGSVPCSKTPPGRTVAKQADGKHGTCPLFCDGAEAAGKRGKYITYDCPTGTKLRTKRKNYTFDLGRGRKKITKNLPPINEGNGINDCCVPNCDKLNSDGLVQCPTYTSMVDNASNVYPDSRDPDDITNKCCPIKTCAVINNENPTLCPISQGLMPRKNDNKGNDIRPASYNTDDVRRTCCGIPNYMSNWPDSTSPGQYYSFLAANPDDNPLVVCGNNSTDGSCNPGRGESNTNIRKYYVNDKGQTKLCGFNRRNQNVPGRIDEVTLLKDENCAIPDGNNVGDNITGYQYVNLN